MTIPVVHLATDRTDSAAEARRHADTGDGEYRGAFTKDAFVSTIEALNSERKQLLYMDVHAHGTCGGGAIAFIDTNPTQLFSAADALERFAGRYDGLFAPGGAIRFVGCNVARGPAGEVLLAVIGKLLLRHGGGYVFGNTEIGQVRHSNSDGRVLGSGEPDFGSDGHWVIATVQDGGTVSLRGHRYLHPGRLRDRIDHIRRGLGAADEGRRPSRPGRNPASSRDTLSRLRDIEASLNGNPSYESIFNALIALQEIEALPWSRSVGNRYRPPFPDISDCRPGQPTLLERAVNGPYPR